MSEEISSPIVDGSPASIPNVFDRARAMFASKSEMQAQLRDLSTQNQYLASQLAEAQEKLASQALVLSAYEKQEVHLKQALEEFESEQKTVAAWAADLVSQTGIPAESLPAQSAEGSDFESRYAVAVAGGSRALGAFLRENREEIRQQLKG